MSPIRFRAWYPILGTMYYDVLVGGLPQTVPSVLDGDRGWVSVWGSNDEGVVMQSTGLYDKNGKEIFEGDIVNVGFGHEWDEPTKMDFVGVIQYDEEFMRFTATTQNGTHTDNYCVEWYEVIGNIHEHPHLLPPQ